MLFVDFSTYLIIDDDLIFLIANVEIIAVRIFTLDLLQKIFAILHCAKQDFNGGG